MRGKFSPSKLALYCLLTCVVSACGIKPMPPETPAAVTPTVPGPEDTSCWGQWRRTRSASAFNCALEEYARAVEQAPEVAENRFRLGVLNWEDGDKDLGRGEIINAVRLDLLNEAYIEYLFAQVIPPPKHVDIVDNLPLYTEQFDAPYFTAQSESVALFEATESHAPIHVAVGASAIRLEWLKPGSTWASLIMGFDEDIANREKALTGGLVSLGNLNSSNLKEYALTFWAKGEDIQGAPPYPQCCKEPDRQLRIKLQDQNLAIRESIGNQMYYEATLTEEWKKYTIPLDDFYWDEWWIGSAVCPEEMYFWDCRDATLFYFDWSRVKQINFDVPFYSTSGKIFLDEIRLVRLK